MIDKLKEAIEERGELVQELDDILSNAEEEKRELKKDEETRYKEVEKEIKAFDVKIKRYKEQEERKLKNASGSNLADSYFDTSDKPQGERFSTRSVSNVNILTPDSFKERSDSLRLGSYLRVIATKDPRNDKESRALSEGTDSEGGYIVPEYMSNSIYGALMNYSSVIQAGAQVVDLTQFQGDTFKYAKVDTLPTFAYYGENSQISESDPVLDTVTFTPKKGAVLFYASNELLQDGIDADKKLEEICLAAAGEEIDKISLIGTGSSNQPTGIVNQSGINTVDFGSGDGAAPTNFDELVDAKYSIINAKGNTPNAVIHHPRTVRDYAKLKDSQNQPLQVPAFLDGVTTYISQALTTSDTQGSGTNLSESIMGDFSQLLIGMRLRPEVFVNPFIKSDYDQVQFRVRFRLDVQVTNPEHFTLMRYVAAAS